MRVLQFVEVGCRKILQPYGASKLLIKCREEEPERCLNMLVCSCVYISFLPFHLPSFH